MTPGTIAILSLGMSADAFAASISRGASRRPSWKGAVRAGMVFGGIEATTPVLGWSLGLIAAGLVQQIDHWIAFALLGAVGGRMVWGAVQPAGTESDKTPSTPSAPWGLVAVAIGTSIDAAAIGVGLAVIREDIWVLAASIGVTTFVLTTAGMRIGQFVGVRFGKAAELAGGLALVGLGLWILLEHLGVLRGWGLID